MSMLGRARGPARRGTGLLGSAGAVGLSAVAVALRLRRRTAGERHRVDELGDQVVALQRRLDELDRATARADDLAAQVASLRGRQLAAETALVDVDFVLKALARQLSGLAEQVAAPDVLSGRVEYLERTTAGLQRESEANGALAATAVAAADEVEVLGESLRQLRTELLQLSARVRHELDGLQRTESP